VPAIEHAVIAAAGMGTRLGFGVPKCLLDVGGKTLLERQLALVADVPDVRIVVGFEKAKIIEVAKEIRRDLIICINAAYRTTTTADSYDMGARGLDGSCLFLDADIIFEPDSFARFLGLCAEGERRIGITDAKTDDAVFAQTDEQGHVVGFSRTERSPFEWANAAWLPCDYFEGHSGDVFARIARDLPVASGLVDSYEVDTEADLARARAFVLDHGGLDQPERPSEP
jgi:choline kinase